MTSANAPDLQAAGGQAPGEQLGMKERLLRMRHRWFPTRAVGEILSKPWIDSAAPALLLIITLLIVWSSVPAFFLPANLSDGSRQIGEFGFIALGMMLVVMAGGVDLSVGSNFAMGNLLALALTNVFGLPVGEVFIIVIAACALIGLINGILIGYLGLRAFLTTLVMLICLRALVDTVLLNYSLVISSGFYDSSAWDFLASGSVLGIPASMVAFALMATVMHVIVTRTRFGWHVMAIGGSRSSAYNAGIPVAARLCATYAVSGAMCGIAACFYAARLANGGSYPGVGLEVLALTAVIVGGVSLGGGRGSVAKACLGVLCIQIINMAVVQAGLQNGAGQLLLGIILLAAIGFDIQWAKHRDKLVSRLYLSPTYFRLPSLDLAAPGLAEPNQRLSQISAIGLGQVDGGEDVVFDREGNLYCGDRRGNIMRFEGPDHQSGTVFAHIGGHPLGMAIDRAGSIVVCVGGMGLYRVGMDAAVEKLTDETNRSPFSIIDDSKLRLADDCDIAPDGKIYFSEATIRFDMATWPSDALECRGNGRIICHDPSSGTTRTVLRNLVFPNGITLAFDGNSILFAESWACRISRLWIAGPRAGQVDRVAENLPGYPDNINRASDGTYWVALMGMRSPALDLALRMPGFRKEMARQIPTDEWLYPNINTGCILKMSEDGQLIDSLWDAAGVDHPMVTSMREHRGHLYVAGIFNNRIGKLALPDADPDWTGPASYWNER